jgi:long-chain acyl-CoA synthetase
LTWFFDDLEGFADRSALCDATGRTVSYGQLVAQADSLALLFGPKRSVVAIEGANRIETVAAYLAALRSDRVAMMINPSSSVETRESLYSRFQVSAVVSYAAGEQTVQQRDTAPAHAGSDVRLLLSTSGSTGSPKFVRLTASNIHANAASIAQYLRLDCEERPLASLPIHYSYGLSIINSHLLVGATIVLSDEPATSRFFWNLVDREAVTSLTGVPATWEIFKSLRFAQRSNASIRYCTQAGGRLSPDTTKYFADWARETSKQFYVMYGQTEATARIAYMPPDQLSHKLGSIGIAIPGGSLSLVDEHGTLINGANVAGEIVYRGPNVMLGYAESVDDLRRGDDCAGVLRTGDLAYRDDEGFYFIVGRMKRFAKVFGNRIDLDEVEALLNRNGVVGAVSQRDEKLLVGVVAADVSPVIALICSELHIHRSAVQAALLDAIPRATSGKILYPELERAVMDLSKTASIASHKQS